MRGPLGIVSNFLNFDLGHVTRVENYQNRYFLANFRLFARFEVKIDEV